MKRYSAKLLFQFRLEGIKPAAKRRLCEERIILLEATSAKSALAQVKRKGKKAQYRYRNAEGELILFEFVGIMDLLHLGNECEADEVWYDIVERLSPMERRDRFIPPEHQLNAMLPGR